MPSAALRIALIEPNAACAAELGQLLSESLQDFRIELSESSAADLVLLNEAESEPPNTPGPTIVFTRSQNGRYRTHALQGSSLSGRQTVPFIMPLTDSIRCALLLQVSRRSEAGPDESKDGVVLPGQSRRLQERLLQLQKMEAIGELAGGIAHDFNNLLLVIRSYAEMLLEESVLPPPARHYAKEILAASQRAPGLTRELLAISRRETPEMRPTNLNGAIESAVPMLSRLVGKDIVVWVKLPTELWPVQANAEQLEQVLINLASNARDAMPRGGKLLLETSNTVRGRQTRSRAPWGLRDASHQPYRRGHPETHPSAHF